MQGNCNQQPFIEVNQVTFGYTKDKKVIKNISAAFYKKQFTAIVGPNGSGKTTLGKLLIGVLKPDQGEVCIDQCPTTQMNLGEIGQLVGYLFQEPERQIFAPSVREEIGFVLDFRERPKKEMEEKVDEMLELFQLTKLKDDFPFQLSRGEKQRLALASILVNEPDFLILDEPTTGLDLKRRDQLSTILKNLQAQGLGLVVISHDTDFVKINADRVITIAGGELIGDD